MLCSFTYFYICSPLSLGRHLQLPTGSHKHLRAQLKKYAAMLQENISIDDRVKTVISGFIPFSDDFT